MRHDTHLYMRTAVTFFCLALATCIPYALSAKQKPEQVTKEGLELHQETRQRLVYLRPGARIAQYDRVALLDCYVEFSDTWLRDYNRSVRDTSARISDEDLARAKTELSAQFRKIFSEELARGGYQMGEADRPGVLVLRPALVNIAVSAPDLMTSGRSTTYAESSGEMTLYLELWDGATNTLLARVIDAQADRTMYGQRTTSVTNRAAADRILTAWAEELRKKLELAAAKPKPPEP